jgi:hypothetical protein
VGAAAQRIPTCISNNQYISNCIARHNNCYYVAVSAQVS